MIDLRSPGIHKVVLSKCATYILWLNAVAFRMLEAATNIQRSNSVCMPSLCQLHETVEELIQA